MYYFFEPPAQSHINSPASDISHCLYFSTYSAMKCLLISPFEGYNRYTREMSNFHLSAERNLFSVYCQNSAQLCSGSILFSCHQWKYFFSEVDSDKFIKVYSYRLPQRELLLRIRFTKRTHFRLPIPWGFMVFFPFICLNKISVLCPGRQSRIRKYFF